MSRRLHVDVQSIGRRPTEPATGAEVVVDLAGRQGRHTAPPGIPDADWWTAARCNDGSGRLAGLFFSPDVRDIARAQGICATCTVLVPCLEGAVERREPRGVWGGQLFVDGRIVATKRRRGRPRKVPTPHDQLPERPLPEQLRGVTVVRRRRGPRPAVGTPREEGVHP
jgi:WhiB family redox-sensing transcriptional regulator